MLHDVLISGFELYSRWVPLRDDVVPIQTKRSRLTNFIELNILDEIY